MPSRFAPLIAISFAALAAPSAKAAERVEILEAGQACPSPAAVAAQLRPLFLTSRVEVVERFTGDARAVELRDLGARFLVTLDSVERIFGDAQRRCDERARIAAAFLALALEPVQLPAPPPSPVRARPRIDIGVDVFALVAGAPRTAPDNGLVAGGGGAKLWAGGKYIAGVLGVAGLSPATSHFSVADATLTRVPFDLSVRGRLPLGRLELNAELGLAVTVLRLAGAGMLDARQSTRAEIGIRGGVAARFWLRGRVAPFLGIEVVGIPTAYTLAVEPVGSIGTTPQVWVGAQLGVAVRIH